MTTTEPKVIFNDSSMYASNIEWRTDIKEEPINDYEKNMLKDTKNTTQLLKEESEEKPLELSDKQREQIRRNDYITRVKVIALHNMKLHPLYNASYLSHREKQKLITEMEHIMKLTDDEILTTFNEICNDKLFITGADITSYPVYNPLGFIKESPVVYDA